MATIYDSNMSSIKYLQQSLTTGNNDIDDCSSSGNCSPDRLSINTTAMYRNKLNDVRKSTERLYSQNMAHLESQEFAFKLQQYEKLIQSLSS